MKKLVFLKYGLFLLFLVEVFIVALATSQNGDDGSYISAGYLASKGLLPLAGFPYSQGPLLPVIYAPFFYLFGPTLIVSRLVGVFFIILIYLLGMRILSILGKYIFKSNSYTYPLNIIFTVVCILYPELWGNLSRCGTGEAVAALFFLLSVSALFWNIKNRYLTLFLSALFVAISFGIKYQAILIILPLFLYVWRNYSLKESIIYIIFVCISIFIIFIPYIVLAKLNHILVNFAIIMKMHIPSSFLLQARSAFFIILRALLRFQIVILPVFICTAYDTARENVLHFLFKRQNLLLTVFIYMSIIMVVIVSAIIARIYTFIPFLFIFSSLCILRIFLSVQRYKPDLVSWLADNKAVILTPCFFILLINLNFFLPLQYCDFYITKPSFPALRWYIDKKAEFQETSKQLSKICLGEKQSLLYLGYHQYQIMPTKCKFSEYSVCPTNFIHLSDSITDADAEKYKFFTLNHGNKLITEKQFDIIVIDNFLFDRNGIDDYGVNYGEMKKTIELYYDLYHRDRNSSIYTRKH